MSKVVGSHPSGGHGFGLLWSGYGNSPREAGHLPAGQDNPPQSLGHSQQHPPTLVVVLQHQQDWLHQNTSSTGRIKPPGSVHMEDSDPLLEVQLETRWTDRCLQLTSSSSEWVLCRCRGSDRSRKGRLTTRYPTTVATSVQG